ncbi:GIY-YIG nuclease family protein [Candidatus Babeliales bacterium]|nr:GIY-YIG nuclease family protein [Candidatus Babeliales bacterium]
MTIIYRAQAVNKNCTYIYIGKTDQKLDDRRQQHEKDALDNSPRSFHQRLRTIDFNKWEWIVLLVCDPTDAIKEEKRMIKRLRVQEKHNPFFVILNDTDKNTAEESNKNDIPNYGIPRSCKQKNYTPGEIGKKFAIVSGKLKPVKNLTTNAEYASISEAEKIDKNSKLLIKKSCSTGRKLSNETRYAFLDLEGNPILTEDHQKDLYVDKRAQKNQGTS